jgi:hypothetical protein
VVPHLRSIHQYTGPAYPDLTGKQVVVVIGDPPEPEASSREVGSTAAVAVYVIEGDGDRLSEFAYAVSAEHLAALDREWSGTLPFPRVVLHPRGDAPS